jgi:ferritin-like metal-binding protein YciE
MGDKRQETITKYLGDMKSVVSHVQTAMTRQKDEFKDKPEVSQAMGRIAFGLQRQDESIGKRLEALGGSPTHPVKEVVSDALGLMAGLYNKVRTEGAAKGLRDDHVALNLVCISYSMLHTTAAALGDAETASLAKRSLVECTKFVSEIDALVPSIVFQELQDGDFGSLDSGAVEQTRAAYREAWMGTVGADERSSESPAGRRP